MPDISMCGATKCADRRTCYRYMAEPSQYQYYFMPQAYPLMDKIDGKCEYYYEVENEKVRDSKFMDAMEKRSEKRSR